MFNFKAVCHLTLLHFVNVFYAFKTTNIKKDIVCVKFASEERKPVKMEYSL